LLGIGSEGDGGKTSGRALLRVADKLAFAPSHLAMTKKTKKEKERKTKRKNNNRKKM
jgi:hypothetical protein